MLTYPFSGVSLSVQHISLELVILVESDHPQVVLGSHIGQTDMDHKAGVTGFATGSTWAHVLSGEEIALHNAPCPLEPGHLNEGPYVSDAGHNQQNHRGEQPKTEGRTQTCFCWTTFPTHLVRPIPKSLPEGSNDAAVLLESITQWVPRTKIRNTLRQCMALFAVNTFDKCRCTRHGTSTLHISIQDYQYSTSALHWFTVQTGGSWLISEALSWEHK